LELDSTKPEKFSRHLIVHLPDKKVFSDNTVSMKQFVTKLCDYLKANNKALVRQKFKIRSKDEYTEKVVPLFDTAVYTKNRNFRLYRSSKVQENSYLILADNCCFYESRGTF
jgi:hypothetical protein